LFIYWKKKNPINNQYIFPEVSPMLAMAAAMAAVTTVAW